jgi:hypothetical protein
VEKQEEVNREGGRGRERERGRGESMDVGLMTKEELGEGMRRDWRRRDYLHPQMMIRMVL